MDAAVKVTLNQSAVPEGMVFDLWAMDEASLLGNPAVAYNQESFTIPAGSVAKDSTVTVEAQYRDATIESEPSILGHCRHHRAWPVQARRSSCGRATASAWSCTRSISSPRRKKLRQSSPPRKLRSCRFLNAGAPAPFHA